MKNNTKIIFTALLAAALGLAVGYFVFSKKTSQEGQAHEMHDSEDTAGEATVYTCSMHPQIRQSEPGDCPICGMELIPAGEVATGSDPTVFEMTETAMKLANVRTHIVGAGESSGEKNIVLNGKIQADERLAASQVAHVPGRIEQLFVSFTGEQIRRRQKLASIYSPELITAQRELLEAKKFADVNPKLLDAARQKLRFWKISESTISDIEASGKLRETFTVFADEVGVVTDRKVAVGDYVTRGEVLFELMSLKRVWALFDVYEEDLPNIRIGDKIEFSTPAVPGKVFSTKITYIDPILDAKKRSVAVRTEIQNKDGKLKPEMLVRGVVRGGSVSQKQLLKVPKSAVLWTGERSVIWVKKPDREIPSFEYQEVVLGESSGDNYLIISGLNAGDEVVVNGAFTLDAAAQLNNQRSMMNQNVQVKKAEENPPDFAAETPAEFKKQLENLATAYLSLKDALVETDTRKATAAAAVFLENLLQVDMMLVQGEAHQFWMGKMKGMEAHAKKIQSEKEVEKQREQFDFFSSIFIETLRAFGTAGQQYFVQYCPMAIGDKGASWLSTEEEVLNPYFGEKMLRCGTVKGEIGD